MARESRSGSPRARSRPGTSQDRPPRVETIDGQPLYRVGIIALLGFFVGVVWPRLAGVSLVPEPPLEQTMPAETAEGEAAIKAPVEAPPREIAPKDRVTIGPAKITSCRDKDGKSVSPCGTLEIDGLVHPTLLAIASCPAANGAFGTLSLGFDLDLSKRKIENVQSGRSTNLPPSVGKEILRCASEGLTALTPASIAGQHTAGSHSSYTVFYVLEFKTPEEVVSTAGEVTPASGKGTVRWQTALIRKEPTRDGAVLTRLLAGAEVLVTGRQGDWYRVKFDAQGREGWVHGAALGL